MFSQPGAVSVDNRPDAPLDNPRITEHPQDHYVSLNNPTKLICSVDGDPEPTVTWYRNGEKVATEKDEIMKHRLHLQQGKSFQLFFLRIIHDKDNQPDIGNYYCNATNIHGSAISNMAAIKLSGEYYTTTSCTLCLFSKH
ncbi:roundabout homolog 2 [Elysia marginata]|uniref:Roundabout homolog 2 n=1 Tax=Elysia marginata TaxID=1093978 RepID=A0AAV4G9B1_9GAST|nr:roundabout homolog 2 [Elysia marginata]